MKIFGHPLHVMLIHFPSALFPMEWVLSFLCYSTGKLSFAEAAYYAVSGAVVMGWLAVVAGLFDLLNVMKEKPAAMKKVLIHGGINTFVLAGYTIIAFAAFKKYPLIAQSSVTMLVVKAGLIIFMIAGNYLGGSLILKDKIAVKQ